MWSAWDRTSTDNALLALQSMVCFPFRTDWERKNCLVNGGFIWMKNRDYNEIKRQFRVTHVIYVTISAAQCLFVLEGCTKNQLWPTSGLISSGETWDWWVLVVKHGNMSTMLVERTNNIYKWHITIKYLMVHLNLKSISTCYTKKRLKTYDMAERSFLEPWAASEYPRFVIPPVRLPSGSRLLTNSWGEAGSPDHLADITCRIFRFTWICLRNHQIICPIDSPSSGFPMEKIKKKIFSKSKFILL